MRIRVGVLLIQALLHGTSHAEGFTFFATSDMHYGLMGSDRGGDRQAVRAGMPQMLNGLPGTGFPSGAEAVAKPKGVLIPGDLVHWEDTALWRQYVSDYAVAGDGKVAFPIYDGTGNHDVEAEKNLIAPLFVERNASRKALFGLTDTDSLGYHYSWDWEGVHFVNLNLTPGTLATANFWNGPARSIEFLRKDLSRHVGVSGRPVFIMQHLPYNDTTYTPDFAQGWISSSRAAMIEALQGYNCIGILHGHTHFRPSAYKYRGLDIFDDGANMSGDILVFRIGGGKLQVESRAMDAWGTVRFSKDISMGKPIPIRPGVPGTVQFRFTVAGRLVHSGTSTVQAIVLCDILGHELRRLRVSDPETAWDGTDSRGAKARRGIYVARFLAGRSRSEKRFYLD